MSQKKRLLFKFYRSYFDVACELSDKDRLSFYDAIMQKEFLGIEPNLKGSARFAYISQKHSIDAQVKGWEDYFKTQIADTHTMIPPIIAPMIQEKDKEKDKAKEITYNKVVDEILTSLKDFFGENYLTSDKTKVMFDKLLKKYSKDEILKATLWARNDDFWKTNFCSPLKLEKKNKEDVLYIDVFLEKAGNYKIPTKQTTSEVGKFELIPINYEY
jgi:hypothetical protein